MIFGLVDPENLPNALDASCDWMVLPPPRIHRNKGKLCLTFDKTLTLIWVSRRSQEKGLAVYECKLPEAFDISQVIGHPFVQPNRLQISAVTLAGVTTWYMPLLKPAMV